MLRRWWLIIAAVGPGIFCIGYTIGTGSVTSMAVAGSRFGMGLLWVLFLSCVFSWVLMEAYGRFAVVTGDTAMHGFRTRIPFGTPLAIISAAGVIVAQWNSLTGILGLCSNAIYEGIVIFSPSFDAPRYWTVLAIAAVLIVLMYGLLLVGRYSFFEKVLIVFVTLMGISFIVSMVVVMPQPADFAAGFVPRIPKVPGGRLLVAAFVGTTMAAPTFVVRPLLMQGKGWTAKDTRAQSIDAAVSALLMFVISCAIMAAATGALHYRGIAIEHVLDMMRALEPMAGRYAVGLFLVGALSAGLSSVFPIMMVAPLLVGDFRAGKLDISSPLFRMLAGIACVFGMTVPILGANPLVAQIATQVANVFALPLVIIGIIVLVNRREMGTHRAGILLNLGLAAAMAFACFISWTGVLAIREFFT